MGKMTMLNTKKPNGDMGRDCEGDKDCHLPTYQLSWSDSQISGMSKNGKAKFKRLMRYKCGDGHRFDRTYVVKKNLLAPVKSNPSEGTDA